MRVEGRAAVLLCFADVAIFCRILIEPCRHIFGDSCGAWSVL
jgi:hypothetical protein